MNIQSFFKAVEAEFVGGRIKAIIDGIHTFIAEHIDGNIVLTAAGAAAKAALETQAPAVVTEVENLIPAVEEVTAALSGGAAAGVAAGPLGALVGAQVQSVAEQAAVSAVDDLLSGITNVVVKKAPAAKKAVAAKTAKTAS